MGDSQEEQLDPSKLLEIEFVENGDSVSSQHTIKQETRDLIDSPLDCKLSLFCCDICPRAFLHEAFLQSHSRVAHGGHLPRRCGMCKQLMTTERGLRRHLQRHVDRPVLQCLRCGRGFHIRARLRQHLKGCLESRAEQCKLCGQRFNYSSTLQRHLQTIHCSERNFPCHECGKSFKLLRYLRRHQIVHTDLKPFKCEYCDRCFNRSGNLDVHARLHTGVKPYRCDVCGLAFRHNVSCKNHRLKHCTNA